MKRLLQFKELLIEMHRAVVITHVSVRYCEVKCGVGDTRAESRDAALQRRTC